MPGQHRVVDDDHVIADPTIVRDMGVDHDQIAIADRGRDFGSQATMDGGVFADHIAAADDQSADFVAGTQVLGTSAQHGTLADFIVTSQPGIRFNDDSGRQSTAVADLDSVLDDAERADRNTAAELGVAADYGRRMNVHHRGAPALGSCQVIGTAASHPRLGRLPSLIGFADWASQAKLTDPEGRPENNTSSGPLG